MLLQFLFICGVTSHSRAGIRPSFMLDHSAWHATDIVVAGEGDTVDGTLSVQEVWKGHLAPGSTLSIPDLAAFSDEEARTVKFRWKPMDHNVQPTVLSGQRMILFLKRSAKVSEEDNQSKPDHWQPASVFEEMRVSVVWIEQENVYAFIQVSNPGPSILMPHELSEEKMKERVSRIVQTQNVLAKITADTDPEKRVKGAAKYVRSDIQHARGEAFRILAGCKATAVPFLKSLLSDETYASQYRSIIGALSSAGGSALGKEFSEIVKEELLFWKEQAPLLEVGWWNGKGLERKDVNTLQNRYSKILYVLYGLQKMNYEGSRKPVRAFRDYWRSLPQLEDKSGLDQMSQACDAVLKTLENKTGSEPRH